MKQLLAVWLAVLMCLCGAIPWGWAEEPALGAMNEYLSSENGGADTDGGNILPLPPADEPDGTEDPLTEPAPGAGNSPDAEPTSDADDTDAEASPDTPEDGSGTQEKPEEAVTDTGMPEESPDVTEDTATPEAAEEQDGISDGLTPITDVTDENDGVEPDNTEVLEPAGDIERPEAKEENEINEDSESPEISEKPEDVSGPETGGH